MLIIMNMLLISMLYKLKYKNSISTNLFIIMFINLIYKFNWIDWSYLMLGFGLNNFNYGLIIMMLWISYLILMNLMKNKFCYNLNYFLIMLMLMNFLSLNLLMFYYMFESSLLLIFYIIMNWGYNINRILASFYLFFYTVFFSIPFLFIIFLMYKMNNSLYFFILELNMMTMNKFMIIIIMFSFLVKIPMFLLHGWLLKAHVEAPFYSSMMLASIMLKLGSYGLLRMIMIFKNMLMFINNYLIIFSLFGMLILSLMCLLQIDMKILVAISSVVHMSLMLMGMMSMMKIGMLGGFLMMMSHGFTSSGLFYLINLVYKYSNSRLLLINKGLITISPSMTMFWFLMCLSNMSAPFTLNLISEIWLLMSMIMFMKSMYLFLMLYCLFSFLYSLHLYNSIQHGYLNLEIKMINGNLFEFFILLMHLSPLILPIFNLYMII